MVLACVFAGDAQVTGGPGVQYIFGFHPHGDTCFPCHDDSRLVAQVYAGK